MGLFPRSPALSLNLDVSAEIAAPLDMSSLRAAEQGTQQEAGYLRVPLPPADQGLPTLERHSLNVGLLKLIRSSLATELHQQAEEIFPCETTVSDCVIKLFFTGSWRTSYLAPLLLSSPEFVYEKLLPALAQSIGELSTEDRHSIERPLHEFCIQVHDYPLKPLRAIPSDTPAHAKMIAQAFAFYENVKFEVQLQLRLTTLEQLEYFEEVELFGAYLSAVDESTTTSGGCSISRVRAKSWLMLHYITTQSQSDLPATAQWTIGAHALVTRPQSSLKEILDTIALHSDPDSFNLDALLRGFSDASITTIISIIPPPGPSTWITEEVSFDTAVSIYLEIFSRIIATDESDLLSASLESCFYTTMEQDELDGADGAEEPRSPFRCAVYTFLSDHFTDPIALEITEACFAGHRDSEADMATHFSRLLKTVSALSAYDSAAPMVLAKKCGIRMFGRYDWHLLAEQHALLQGQRQASEYSVQPGFIVTGTHDHNCAFYDIMSAFPADLPYFVTEVKNLRSLIKAIRSFTRIFGPIQAGGSLSHGGVGSLAYGVRGDEVTVAMINGKNQQAVGEFLRSSVADEADLIVYACHSANRGSIQEVVADILSGKGVRSFGCYGQNHFWHSGARAVGNKIRWMPHFDVAPEEPSIENATRTIVK